jgi:cytochrome c biogenesis protein CcdA
MSLLGALTPLGKVAHGKKLWLRCVLAYTVAGSVSAITVGILLGQIGRWLGGNTTTKLYVLSLVSLILAAREWGWMSFRLPERRCQTEKAWAHEFGFVIASAMWGFHIGLGFATWTTFGGFFVVVAFALVVANPMYGGVLMLVYWLGRSLPVWLAPGLLCSAPGTVLLTETIFRSRCIYHRIAGVVLAWSSGATMLVALRMQASLPSNPIAWR